MTLGPDILLTVQTHDLDMSTGDLVLGLSISQAIRIRLKFFRAEWFLDTSLGIPYFEQIFVKNPNLAHVAAVLRKEISETPGVKDILSFSLDFDENTRVLSVDWEADTDQGEVSGSEIVVM